MRREYPTITEPQRQPLTDEEYRQLPWARSVPAWQWHQAGSPTQRKAVLEREQHEGV